MGGVPPRAPVGLRYALLGLLVRRDLTGYEILKRFNRSIVFFWHAKRSQVYAELKRAERDGLVSSRVIAQRSRPNKRHYSITTAGRSALRAWLDQPTPAQPIKDEALLRAFSGDLLPPDRAIEHLRRHGSEHRRVLVEFLAIRDALVARYGPPESTGDRALFFGYLVLEQGIRYEQMYAEWCRWAAGQIEARREWPVHGSKHDPARDFLMG